MINTCILCDQTVGISGCPHCYQYMLCYTCYDKCVKGFKGLTFSKILKLHEVYCDSKSVELVE